MKGNFWNKINNPKYKFKMLPKPPYLLFEQSFL